MERKIVRGSISTSTRHALLLIALLGIAHGAATGQISFVQVAASTPQSNVASVQVSYPHTQTAGDLNVIVVGWNDSSASIRSVTDTHKNTYVLAAGPIKGTALTQSIYYAKNVAAGTNNVTVSFNKAAAYPDIRILEFKGLSTTVSLDISAGASGKSNSNTLVSSGSATTRSATELIIGAGITSGGFSKAASLFTVNTITRDGSIAEDEAVSKAGTYSAAAVLGHYGEQYWVMQMVAFRSSAVSSSGNNPSISSISPGSGSSSGGSSVTITGKNFQPGATVTFGGTAASNVKVISSSSITAKTPAHAAGTVNLVVSDSSGTSTLANAFTYNSNTSVQHKVVLSWKASSSSNVTGYNVYRSTISGGYYGLIGSTSGSFSYTDATVASGTTYYYVTRAVNTEGQQSSDSNQIAVTVP